MTEHRRARGRKPLLARGCLIAVLAALLPAALAASAATATSSKPRAGKPAPRAAKTNVHATIHKAGDSLAGRAMWIWYISRSNGGSLSSIISTARKYGLSTVLIKSADGPTMWSQFNPQVVQALHGARLRVCAWQYVYGNHPLLEAGVAATAVHDGADCLVIDAESEYEGKYVAAQRYMTQLRRLIGQSYPVALAGFPYIDYHPGFPYSVFLGPGGAQYNAPQMYWLDIGTTVNNVYAHTYTYNRVFQRRIDPLGQVWQNPPPGQIIRFRQLSRTYGSAGVSWWNWQQASPSGWRSIAVGVGNLSGVAPATTTPVLTLRSKGDLVVWAQEHLVSAGYPTTVDGGYGPLTQAAVASFQTAHGLTVDGVVGPATWAALLTHAPARVTWTHRGAVVASAAAVHSVRAGRSLVLQVPKSARLPARRDEIAGAGGRG